MKLVETEICDVKILEPRVFKDDRGYFFEAFNEKIFLRELGRKPNFCQINESASTKGTIRGLHMQKGTSAQAKLVRVIHGEIIDVAVDCRLDSPSCGSHVAICLSSENKRQLWIPEGFAHGFQVLSDYCILNYCVTSQYRPSDEVTINCYDEDLNVGWANVGETLLSKKDQSGIAFASHIAAALKNTD
ncbi:dTDP-4-dehydrorhamnose 3,5-epimerase [Alphaproteobacteria bacterium]|nr:dTDP-4-dehydrorhamnose 3,5-epimerase [Alphaproteobacteria bacterium]